MSYMSVTISPQSVFFTANLNILYLIILIRISLIMTKVEYLFKWLRKTLFSFDVNSLFKSFASLSLGPSMLFLWGWRAFYRIRKSAICLPIFSICHFSSISPLCCLFCHAFYSFSFITGSLNLWLLNNA